MSENIDKRSMLIITIYLVSALIFSVAYITFGQKLVAYLYNSGSVELLNKITQAEIVCSLEYYFQRVNDLFLMLMIVYFFVFCIAAALLNLTNKVVDTLICIIIVVGSFIFSIKAGERGFLAVDHSVFFDGGYRVLCGQIPYKDFLSPFGPAIYWIQALFFRIFGVRYFSYLLSAAFLNALAVGCSLIVLRLLFPRQRFLSYIAGFLTAVWFYPPCGVLWMGHTGFFFGIVAVTLILLTLNIEKFYSKGNVLLLFCSGAVLFFSFLTKQNTGIFIFPIFFLLIAIIRAPKFKQIFLGCSFFISGLVASGLLFLLWVLVVSDMGNFLEYFFMVPAELGRGRLFCGLTRVVSYLVIGPAPMLVKIATSAVLVIAVFVAADCAKLFRTLDRQNKGILLSCVMAVYFILFQRICMMISCNQPENSFGYIGIILATGCGLFTYLTKAASPAPDSNARGSRLRRSILRTGSTILICLVTSSVLAEGVRASLDRRVHDAFKHSVFVRAFSQPGLKHLSWGEPTQIMGEDVSSKDIVSLYNYLKYEDRNFFIFPDFTIFYGLIGKPSPQPLLFFAKGYTYPKSYRESLDKWVVDDLKNNQVDIIIIEEKSWCNTEVRLADFPILDRFIQSDFKLTKQIGIFKIFSKK